jgi:3-oxoacyl-[acyl-carrier protein] reductase
VIDTSKRYGDERQAVFRKAVAEGRVDKGMPSWRGVLSDERLAEVWAFLETIQARRVRTSKPAPSAVPASSTRVGRDATLKPMDLQLNGKHVLVTGGSRGIGLACVETFLNEGCHVTAVTSARTSDTAALHSLGNAHAGRLTTLSADLAEESGQQSLADTLVAADIVVNNAGAIPGGGLDAIDSAAWHRAWDLKVFGYINLTRQALAAMTARGHGVIVNVIGIAGVDPRYDYLCGSAGNAALVAFTKAVGGHASRQGVRVLGVNPGPTRTERLMALYRARALERFGDAERWQELLAHLPFGRPAEAQEMADLVVYLASAGASYLSGVVVDADGGGMYVG